MEGSLKSYVAWRVLLSDRSITKAKVVKILGTVGVCGKLSGKRQCRMSGLPKGGSDKGVV